MPIGVVPALESARGGVYQYSLTMLRALDEIAVRTGDTFLLFGGIPDHPALRSLSRASWTKLPLAPQGVRARAVDALKSVVGEGPHRDAWRSLRRRVETAARGADPYAPRVDAAAGRWFRRCGAEMLLFPAPEKLSFESGVPYVMAVHDLQHRLQPEFPEVSADGEWEQREYLFRNGCRRATLLLADSETGKEDILRFYGEHGVTPDRVKVLPFLPPSYLARNVSRDERRRVRAKYGLPPRFVFYPAQFWPHKNHVRLVRAIGWLKRERNLDVPAVFAGSPGGDLRERTCAEVVAASRELGIEKAIRFPGYVPDDDMAALYAEAAALVMPTFFGPTNIPVLEAWALGCPVLTSDIRGIREQAGDAAWLADPRSVEAIAEGIGRLWTDEALRAKLAENGRKRLSAYGPAEHRDRLAAALDEARDRVAAARRRSAPA